MGELFLGHEDLRRLSNGVTEHGWAFLPNPPAIYDPAAPFQDVRCKGIDQLGDYGYGDRCI